MKKKKNKKILSMKKYFLALFISISMLSYAQTKTNKWDKPLFISDSIKVEILIHSIDSKIKDKSKGEFFSWEDVFASMREGYKKVKKQTKKCHECHKNTYVIWFSSPVWTWEEMCGTAGPMRICINCPKQIDYESSIQN